VRGVLRLHTVTGESLAQRLGALVRTAIERSNGAARAAFYVSDDTGIALYHVIGMPPAYAQCVDGFAISPESLACGLAASTGQAIITRDVAEEPRWQRWLWLAREFDYRSCWSFPVKTPAGRVVGTFAMYFKEPREATQAELALAAALTRVAAGIISPEWQPVTK